MSKYPTVGIPDCECTDSGCPAHYGSSTCPIIDDVSVLYRIDMEDATGTQMCGSCADDAMESGVFTMRGDVILRSVAEHR